MEHGIGFDGSNYGYAMVDNSDMVFIPDLATGIVDPYAQIPTLAFVGDVMVIQQPHNRPFAQYPRNVARRAVAYMQETGIADEMIIGPEYEYHMFDALRYQVEPNRMGFALESRGGLERRGPGAQQRLPLRRPRGLPHRPAL